MGPTKRRYHLTGLCVECGPLGLTIPNPKQATRKKTLPSVAWPRTCSMYQACQHIVNPPALPRDPQCPIHHVSLDVFQGLWLCLWAPGHCLGDSLFLSCALLLLGRLQEILQAHSSLFLGLLGFLQLLLQYLCRERGATDLRPQTINFFAKVLLRCELWQRYLHHARSCFWSRKQWGLAAG